MKIANIQRIEHHLEKLNKSIVENRSKYTTTRIWSEYVKIRDGNKCLKCFSRQKIEAHHIFRKCFQEQAKFYTGNGISLCKECHKEIHKKFNRKPISEIMNADGGDDPDYITENFFYLFRDAKKIFNTQEIDRYYRIEEELLEKSKYYQGIDIQKIPHGPRIQQAFWLWRQCPPKALKELMANEGLVIDPPFEEGVTIVISDNMTAVTLVDSGDDFEIQNRGSATMGFDKDKDINEIVRFARANHPHQKIIIKDFRSAEMAEKNPITAL